MLLIQSLTALKLVVLTLSGVAILRIWLKSTLMEDNRERLKLLNEKHLLGLGAKISELSQCAHCLSVHIGMLLAASMAVCALIMRGDWTLSIIAVAAVDATLVGLSLSVCIELTYRLIEISLAWLQDAEATL
jgi:hypothetical protein